MIKSTITTLTLTAGLSGLLVWSPLSPTPPETSAPETSAPAMSFPVDSPSVPAPLVDEASFAIPAPTALPRAMAHAGPDVLPLRRLAERTERRANAELILQEFKHLRQVWGEAESTYEKNVIEARLDELKAKLDALGQAGPRLRARARSGGEGGGIARTPRSDFPRGPRGFGSGVGSPPNADRKHEVRAELEAALKKARDLEWDGQHDEAEAIRDRIRAAKEKYAQAGVERGSRGFGRSSRADQPGKVIRQLSEMLRKAEALAARGDYEAAKEVHAQAQALAAEAGLVAGFRERRADRTRSMKGEEIKNRLGAMLRKAEELAAQGDYRAAKAIHAKAEAVAAEARHIYDDARARERGPRPDRSIAPRSERPLASLESRQDWQGKIEHMIMAAENLRAAGMHRQADGLLKEVQSMKQRRKEQPQQHRDLAHEVDALRDEVHELRAIVHEMMTRARSHSSGR